MKRELYAAVIPEVSINKTLDYSIKEEEQELIQRGSIVEIPIRGRLQPGYVFEVKKETSIEKIKSIHRLKNPEPILTEELFMLAIWMAEYYICPLGSVIRTMLPKGVRSNTGQKKQYFITRLKTKGDIAKIAATIRPKAPQQAHILDCMLKAKKGLLLSELLELSSASQSSLNPLVEKKILGKTPIFGEKPLLIDPEYFKTKPKILREEQKNALDSIVDSINKNSFAPHLLFGVTGSGKTEVYLQAIEHTLQQGKSVLMLVPEIALTEQTVNHFRARFSCPMAILHHKVSDGERASVWNRMRKGEISLCLGARSAVFAPLHNLGLIIVDEEHESSYKSSDERPCYHARDLAVMRAKQEKATIVLGSATPSIESFQNALKGRYTLNKLTYRPSGSLPTIIPVNPRENPQERSFFAPLLIEKIKERKALGEQTILFLNRRGFHTMLACAACGEYLICPHCDIKLAFHKKYQTMLCHMCGHTCQPPPYCPSCKEPSMTKFQGAGTEKVEAALKAILPNFKVLRIDADTTRHKGSLSTLLQQFRAGKADILVGTQMIAKGLHFPDVSLVGILNVDSSLNLPDFKASEQVFQLATQVAGRAGRGVAQGEVIIQTQLKNHPVMQHALKQDYEGFFSYEIESRKLFGFPPFNQIVKILFTGKNNHEVEKYASHFVAEVTKTLPKNFFCHPLTPSGHSKIKDQYRFQFFIRGPSVSPIRLALERVSSKIKPTSTVSTFIDVNPLSIFF